MSDNIQLTFTYLDALKKGLPTKIDLSTKKILLLPPSSHEDFVLRQEENKKEHLSNILHGFFNDSTFSYENLLQMSVDDLNNDENIHKGNVWPRVATFEFFSPQAIIDLILEIVAEIGDAKYPFAWGNIFRVFMSFFSLEKDVQFAKKKTINFLKKWNPNDSESDDEIDNDSYVESGNDSDAEFDAEFDDAEFFNEEYKLSCAKRNKKAKSVKKAKLIKKAIPNFNKKAKLVKKAKMSCTHTPVYEDFRSCFSSKKELDLFNILLDKKKESAELENMDRTINKHHTQVKRILKKIDASLSENVPIHIVAHPFPTPSQSVPKKSFAHESGKQCLIFWIQKIKQEKKNLGGDVDKILKNREKVKLYLEICSCVNNLQKNLADCPLRSGKNQPLWESIKTLDRYRLLINE